MDSKTRGIVSYLGLIGWIIAIATNSPKEEQTSFHLRQMLGLMLLVIPVYILAFVFVWVPVLGWLLIMAMYAVTFVLWVLGFISALQGERKEVPVVGALFQDWFKSL